MKLFINNMRILYVKELKALRAPLFILSAAYFCYFLFFLLIDVTLAPRNLFYYREILQVLVMLNMLIIPGLFIYSFYDEKNKHTSHQLLSFPVPRCAVMLNKFFAMMSVAFVAALVLGLCNYIIELRVTVTANPKNHWFNDTGMISFRFITVSYSMLCIAAATTGILSVMKRYRVMTGVFSFAGFFMLSLRMNKFMRTIYTESVFSDTVAKNAQVFENLLFVVNVYLPLISGTIFLLAGLYVFHKYGDI
ncbi:ABC transporter permease [Candidatus Latescibacterota bacterium]